LTAGTFYKSSEYCTQLALLALTVSLINLAVRDPRRRSFALKGVFDFGWLLVFGMMVSVYVGILIWPEFAIRLGERDAEGALGFSIQGALPAISSNAVGQLGAIMGIMALVRLLQNSGSRIFYGSILAFSLPTMVLTQSRSPILAFAVAVVVILLASRRYLLVTLSGGLLGATTLLTQQGQLVYEFMRRGQSAESLTGLTGRVDFWTASLEAVSESPFGGYGAYNGGRFVLSSVLGDEGSSTVHSLWVEVLLDTGIVGLILLSIGVGATWFWLFKLRPYAMKTPINRLLWFECLGILTIMCVRSVFAVEIVWDWSVLFFGLVLVFISVIRRQAAETHYAGAALVQPLPTTRWRKPSIRS
jgi:O-antigen ligase